MRLVSDLPDGYAVATTALGSKLYDAFQATRVLVGGPDPVYESAMRTIGMRLRGRPLYG